MKEYGFEVSVSMPAGFLDTIVEIDSTLKKAQDKLCSDMMRNLDKEMLEILNPPRWRSWG